VELAPFIVCPETLGSLEPAEGGYWSSSAERLYPVRRGLVFMGYPSEEAARVESTMEDERRTAVWQGSDEGRAATLALLRTNAPQAVDLINIARRYVPRGSQPPRALVPGCGHGWVSWLLAEAGFETWMCNFEPNALAAGLNLTHPNVGEGRRFVTDARCMPFAGGSFDLVVFKEIVRTVRHYRSLFREANRVLRDGGIMALMEPVRSVRKTVYELRHPGPYEGQHIAWPDAYLRAIRVTGMRVVHQTPVYSPAANRRPLAAWMKERAAASVDEARPAGNWLAKLQLRVFGGAELIIVARKTRHVPPAERPRMVNIDPDTLVVDDDSGRYAEFAAALQDAASQLIEPATTPAR
jgi:SAM-dependent methyltransferase